MTVVKSKTAFKTTLQSTWAVVSWDCLYSTLIRNLCKVSYPHKRTECFPWVFFFLHYSLKNVEVWLSFFTLQCEQCCSKPGVPVCLLTPRLCGEPCAILLTASPTWLIVCLGNLVAVTGRCWRNHRNYSMWSQKSKDPVLQLNFQTVKHPFSFQWKR